MIIALALLFLASGCGMPIATVYEEEEHPLVGKWTQGEVLGVAGGIKAELHLSIFADRTFVWDRFVTEASQAAFIKQGRHVTHLTGTWQIEGEHLILWWQGGYQTDPRGDRHDHGEHVDRYHLVYWDDGDHILLNGRPWTRAD